MVAGALVVFEHSGLNSDGLATGDHQEHSVLEPGVAVPQNREHDALGLQRSARQDLGLGKIFCIVFSIDGCVCTWWD